MHIFPLHCMYVAWFRMCLCALTWTYCTWMGIFCLYFFRICSLTNIAYGYISTRWVYVTCAYFSFLFWWKWKWKWKKTFHQHNFFIFKFIKNEKKKTNKTAAGCCLNLFIVFKNKFDRTKIKCTAYKLRAKILLWIAIVEMEVGKMHLSPIALSVYNLHSAHLRW